MFDCHMHSNFSTDSVMEASEACDRALELGLEGIAFTDHLDFDYPGETFLIDYNQYFAEMNKVASAYDGRLKVLKAIEVGIQPHVIKDTLHVVQSYPFDYVLASVHIVGGEDPYTRTYYQNKDKITAYGRYLEEILYMISNYVDFDMVGHFEYIIRYPSYADRSLRYADHSDLFDAILRKLITLGRGFEVNTGTYRNPHAAIEYDRQVLKRYHELGGELICLSSDAHRPEHIGLRFTEFSQMLKDTGFNYTVHYENRKPVFDRL